MIIIIDGAPGSGKTMTAKYLMETTNSSAIIDGDWLLGINPINHTDDELHLRYKNIADLARNFHQAGYDSIFISFVYMGPNGLKKQLDLLTALDTVKVFALVPNEETLRKRHAEDSYVREEIESSIEINRKIASIENIHIIDNSYITINEVGERIKEIANL